MHGRIHRKQAGQNGERRAKYPPIIQGEDFAVLHQPQ